MVHTVYMGLAGTKHKKKFQTEHQETAQALNFIGQISPILQEGKWKFHSLSYLHIQKWLCHREYSVLLELEDSISFNSNWRTVYYN